MKSKVYFYDNLDDLKSGVNKFFEIISKDLGKDNIGLKVHFGEKDNDTHIDPRLLKDVTKYFNKPKFIECNVLYKGTRTKKDDHIKNISVNTLGYFNNVVRDLEEYKNRIAVLLSGGLDSSILCRVCQNNFGTDTSYSTGYPFAFESLSNHTEEGYQGQQK